MALLANFEAKCDGNGVKKLIMNYNESVLEYNFATIRGSV